MRIRREAQFAAIAAVGIALGSLLASCGEAGDGDAGVITASSSEPKNPLIPTNTAETGGGNVIDLLFEGLVSYEADGTPRNEVAESIESEDNRNWTIKIKTGLTFSDGTEIKAKHFVDAWNYGATAKNGQVGSYFFEPFKGYAEASAEGSKVDSLSGLKILDDHTFTAELTEPQSDFPLRLGYAAYAPLPELAYKDIKAFGQRPIGNGPYKLSKEGWVHKRHISLVPNEKYEGHRTVRNEGIKFVVHINLDSAYSDIQAGNLDILVDVPASALTSFKTEKGLNAFSRPGSVFMSFTIGSAAEHFGQNQEGKLRRQALSLATDREMIADRLYYGSLTPATDFGSPVLPAHSKDLRGSEVLKYDPQEAKRRWAEADKISDWGDTKFTLTYNSDAPNKVWVEAVTNQFENVLGIQAKPQPIPTFDEFLERTSQRTVKFGFSSSWQPDYPSLYNYLAPLYASAAADGKGANDGDYKSKEFDEKLAASARAESEAERTEALHDAEEILLQDLPAIPLWYYNVSAVTSEDVNNVEFNWKNVPEYQSITK
jgi:oligopeptide transport system substrate-binding protein